MSGPGRRFDPAELRTSGAPGDSQPSDVELAQALGIARDLEALAASDVVGPTDGFEDRVMAAIALEPAPRLVIPASDRRRGGIAGFIAALGTAWGVATGGGRPLAVRAQALGFVVLVVVAAGALTAVTAVTVGGWLQAPTPVPSVPPAPTVAPTVAPTPSLVAPSASPIPSPTASASPEPTESLEPDETPGPNGTDDHGGDRGGGGGDNSGSGSTDDHGGDGGSGNSGPGSTDDHGGSGSGSGSDGGSGGSGSN